MSDAAGPAEAGGEAGRPAPRGRGGAKLLLAALVLGLLGGGGAFYAVYSGLVELPFGRPGETAAAEEAAQGEVLAPDRPAAPPPAYVALDPMVVSLAPEANARHLKIALQVEVAPGREAEVAAVVPRIRDVLNGFLRAVDAGVLERPQSMARLRAQMLRRVRLVAPEGAVRDLLIQEFVLN